VETPRQNLDVDTLVKEKKKLIGLWKSKHEQEMEKKEESMLVQTSLHAQNKGNQWYIDNGCSSYMTGDKRKFLTLKEVNEGSVTFGSDATTRIARKDTLSLNNGKTKTKNVLYVDSLKHNLLCVSQMCGQGHNLTFYSQGCEIRKEG
jgi:hypothetical protein